MDSKAEGAFSIVGALLVLFTAMLNPIVSVGLSTVLLVAYAVYSFAKRR